MSTSEKVLRDAILAHRAGRLAEAEVGYRRVLRTRPTHADALHFLGLLHFRRGETDAAVQCVSRSLEHVPGNPRAWIHLGGMLIATGSPHEAKDAYRKATEVGAAMAEGWYNLGICLRDEGNIDGAEASLRQAIAREAGYFRAYEALAMLLYQLGRMHDAAVVYEQWSTLDPASARARHMAAAVSGQNVPGRASDAYVQELFDTAAAGFDANLDQLGYRAPQLVAAAFARAVADHPALDVLDAGCGTGLCGKLIRTQCRRLVGVDLSQKMLDHACARGCYDELIAAELCAYMRSRQCAFDAVLIADTLVYFGPLDEPLAAARESLRDSGLLIATLEALTTGADHRLEFHGRYAHSEPYLRSILFAAGYQLEAISCETLRQERLQDVAGYLVVARRR